ncbi:MAG: YtxH domain-containing protein [Bacteroides sp.]|nr:YtxH domain-containing protein [Bacteroides sp.]MCM1456244.1 YtxH domain-containing protein [Lachnoclostridium sp.]
MKHLFAFLGGAIVGAAAALLFAPEKGEDLRERIKEILRRNGLCPVDDDLDEVVERIAAEIEAVPEAVAPAPEHHHKKK